ncbi:Capsid protein VP1, partial [Dissostichus eleginoides]
HRATATYEERESKEAVECGRRPQEGAATAQDSALISDTAGRQALSPVTLFSTCSPLCVPPNSLRENSHYTITFSVIGPLCAPMTRESDFENQLEDFLQ